MLVLAAQARTARAATAAAQWHLPSVTLALHAPACGQDRLREYRTIREPLARFEQALAKALPEFRPAVKLLAVDVDAAS